MPHDPNDPVVHIKQPHDIYIGRPKANQPWNFGNPFRIGPDGDRDTVISKFESWIVNGESFSNPDATPARRQWILSNLPSLVNKKLGCFCRPGKCHGDILCKLLKASTSPAPAPAPTPTSATTPSSSPISWARHGGYEVSTKGDPRFSAFNAIMPDGRSIEQHYQGDVKGYDPGGRNWRLGKGKPPLKPMTPEQLKTAYLALWVKWAEANPKLILELRDKVAQHNNLLSDRFASSGVNQAWALSEILNRISNSKPSTPAPEPPILDKRMALRQPGEIFDVTPLLSPKPATPPSPPSPSIAYAGIGSRESPENILSVMRRLGKYAASQGHILRSGGAVGADTAFETGAREHLGQGPNPLLQIFLQQHATPEAHEIASRYHPNWANLSPYVKALHARNAFQVLGPDLKSPSQVVLAYTHEGRAGGGTGQALRIAQAYGIPIVDLGHPDVLPHKVDEKGNPRINTIWKSGKKIQYSEKDTDNLKHLMALLKSLKFLR